MIKRAFDILLSVVGLILISPFLLLIALAIKLYDFGPVFYRQERIGRFGRPFRMWKFRSMVVGADRLGGQLTVSGDRRITPLGRVLRAVKADELPQLINVLCGEMSLIGPRPEVAKYVALYSPDQKRVLELRPGITDLASFAFFDESELLARASDPEEFYVRELIPEKIRINLAYAERASVGTDVVLIFATIIRSVGVRADLFSWLKIPPPRSEARA